MKKNQLINHSYIIAAILSNNFFISKVLFNNLYQITSDGFVYYAIPTFILILITSPMMYQNLSNNKEFSISTIGKITLTLYIFFSCLFAILVIGDFCEVHWLSETPIYIIMGSFILVVLYSLSLQLEDIYTTLNILFIPFLIILICYFIFKYEYINITTISTYSSFKFSFDALIISILIFLQTFSIFLLPKLDQTIINKSSFYIYIIILLMLVGLKTLIHYNEFNIILDKMLYPFFESYNIIYFGQYIGYINFPVLFYYLISGFSFIALYLKIFHLTFKNYQYTFLMMIILTITSTYLLMHDHLNNDIKPPIFIVLAILSIFTLIFHIQKESS